MAETTMYYLSNHPIARKVAANRASMYRIKALPARQNGSKENDILYSKQLTPVIFHKWLHKLNNKKLQLEDRQNNISDKKCIIFTYFSPQIRIITNLFKHTNTYCVPNHELNIPPFKNRDPKNNVYDSSGIYGLIWATYHLNYMGQTGRSLKQLYSDHIRYIRCNKPAIGIL